jgi:glycosyltransferase involved in cell wall biosynthesis
MNCYNGEKYLSEAIESVFMQAFTDWEIVFVDNCSIDNSEKIATSFGSKLKFFKTPANVPLGEARAFGIEKCIGKFLMYLDVDDRYHENTVSTLFAEINGSNNLVVYAGHKNIDHSGNVIGAYKPRPKSGNIFASLLSQFDIPTASMIMNLDKYRDLGHTYDKEIVVSSEYNHFLQLSVYNDFKCISGEIVDYRIHAGGLTTEKQSYAFQDRIFTLEKIISQNPGVLEQFPKEFKEAFARADYYKARTYISKNDMRQARQIMRKNVFVAKKYLLVYLLLFFPKTIREYIWRLKYSI